MTQQIVKASANSRLLQLIRGCAIAYTVFLTYLTLSPNPWWLFGADTKGVEQAVDSTVEDWIQHSVAYGLLAGLVALSRWPGRRGLWLAAVLSHALLTEWLQGFIPNRTRDWTDELANGLGVACGWLIAVGLLHLISGRRPTRPSESDKDALEQNPHSQAVAGAPQGAAE